uniref:Prokineticin 1 n=1 Tax=Cyprinus carpio TaxID=7962 RepID=A0A8C1Z0C6_CYPCA
MSRVLILSVLLLSLSWCRCAVITGACDRDLQCGVGLCCAVSLWLRGLRMCTPQGLEGDECHPYSHKLSVFGLAAGSFPWQETTSHLPLPATSGVHQVQ